MAYTILLASLITAYFVLVVYVWSLMIRGL